MKQSNVAFMFCLSCIVGSQAPDRLKVMLVLWITAGASMAVTGEMKFVLVGFLIQLVSQWSECGKNILQEWILSGSEIKLDPLTYQLFMAPLCLVLLVVGDFFTWQPEMNPHFLEWYPYLIVNALCAFALNVTIATVIKEISAT